MTQQFTASEVRGQIAWLRNVTVVGTKTTYQMLTAFADLLEAREKAVPVAVVKDSDALYTGWLPWTGEPAPPETKLYTHPAPSDAERLAEALERTARHRAAADRINPDQWCSVLYSWEDRALAAHSAQAQPPAASVTDAMVERAFDKLLADGLDDLDRPKIEGMRAALEAALAAQENPNG